MVPTKEHIRFFIYTRYKHGIRARPIHEELVKAYFDHAPSFRTKLDGSCIFLTTESVEYEARAGRPTTSVTDSLVKRAETLIAEDPTITLRFFALKLGVGNGSAHTIVHEQLCWSKKCARWVPRQLTKEQRDRRVTICRKIQLDHDNACPHKERLTQSYLEQSMVTI